MPVLMNGVDLDSVSLMTSAGWSIAGRVIADTSEASNVPRDRESRRIADQRRDSTAAGPGAAANADNGRVTEDWTFAVTGLPVRRGFA